MQIAADLLHSAEFRSDYGKGARGVVEACPATEKHARQWPLWGKSALREPGADTSFGVGQIDIDRALDRGEGTRKQCLRHMIVLCDQRSEMRSAAAVATEHEAGNAAMPFRDQFGSGQPPAQAL